MSSCYEASCPHLSVPVEIDESMTSSSLNLAWPECRACSLHSDDITSNNMLSHDVGVGVQGAYFRGQVSEFKEMQSANSAAMTTSNKFGFPEVFASSSHHLQPPIRQSDHYLTDKQHKHFLHSFRNNGLVRSFGSEMEQSLEKPLPLRSDGVEQHYFASPPSCSAPRHCHQHPARKDNEQARLAHPAMAVPQDTAPIRDVITEVSPIPFPPIGINRGQEVKRVISLPEECRSVFITYSLDTAREIIPFVEFLISQGFSPAIDIFEDAVRQMDVNKWMDGYLKNKSVLIIIVISPRYKLDVDGDGSDQHGLHTKYIYTQLQNEFIQHRCLNFRIIPVLFPNANQSHVPMWMQSTRVFRWPQDSEDLILRLLRMEKYIIPPIGRDLTLSIRPV